MHVSVCVSQKETSRELQTQDKIKSATEKTIALLILLWFKAYQVCHYGKNF